MRFRAKPFVVEAHQFTGTVSDLPLAFATYVTQEVLGGAAYLPSSVNHTTLDGDPIYAAADIVEPGYYIIRTGDRFWSMSPGHFEAWFEEMELTADAGVGRWLATWHGGLEGEPTRLDWLERVWRPGVPVFVNNPVHFELLRLNSQFTVEDTYGGHGGAIGSEGASQAGIGDCPTSVDHVGHDDLYGCGHSDPGAPGTRGDRAADELAGTLARRGPGRPRKQDAAVYRPVADRAV